MTKIIYNIGMLATPVGPAPKKGAAMSEINIRRDAYVAIRDGKFIAIGKGSGYKDLEGEKINAEGCLVTPGFIDAHNHLVFAGSREHEFRMRLSGAAYLDVLAAGGGILETVRKTRAAGFYDLYNDAFKALSGMLLLGITTAEAKSGYGLDRETELRQLRVIKKLRTASPVRLVSTYLGAHALPEEYKDNRRGYLDLIRDTIDEIKQENLAEFCDVFCEKGVFSYEESREILLYAKEQGFKIRIHADEMTASGGSRLAAELGAAFADHLLASEPRDIEAMIAAGVILLVLPLTSFILDKPFANVGRMIDMGAAVALATDYNPGSSPSYNIHLAMQTAVIKGKMTPEQALAAVTLNPAYGLGLADSKGSVEVGKDADFIVFNCRNLDYFFYRVGENLVRDVYIGGEKKVSNGGLHEL